MNEINPQYSPWVKKLLVLKLFSPGSGSAWMDHALLIHSKYKNRGILLGTLDRDEVEELRSKWTEAASPYLEDPQVHPDDKAALRKDLEAVKWAGICLDRLIEHEAAEEWRNTSPAPAPPLQSDPASGENDQAKRGESLEDPELQFAQVGTQSADFQVEEQSQPEPALPPMAPLSHAQDSEVPPEPSTEHEPDTNLFIQNPEGAMRRANFREGAVWLVGQCQAAYERLETSTDLQEAEDIIHAQRLANDWADEIKADQLVRDHLSAILVRSLRRLGQIRAGFRKNGSLKRGKGAKQLFVGLDKNTLRQSDKLAKIEEDEDFEQRLNQKLKTGELTKYTALEDPPAPKEQPESALFYRLMAQVCEKFPFYKEGEYAKENPHEWAKCVMGGRREMIRFFATKLVELLGPEN